VHLDELLISGVRAIYPRFRGFGLSIAAQASSDAASHSAATSPADCVAAEYDSRIFAVCRTFRNWLI
jgi:hypothetical protein